MLILTGISSTAWQLDSLSFPKNERQHLPHHMNPSAEDLGNTSLFPATSRDSSEVFPATARVNPARPTMPQASPAHDGTTAVQHDWPHCHFAAPLCLTRLSPARLLCGANPARDPQCPSFAPGPAGSPAELWQHFHQKQQETFNFL